VVVDGSSMAPTLLAGDRLVVVRPVRMRVGQLVAVRDPRRPDRVMVKRVASVGPLGVDVRGDNPMLSTDSRAFGPVAPTAVIGRVLWRYAPADRAGAIAGLRVTAGHG